MSRGSVPSRAALLGSKNSEKRGNEREPGRRAFVRATKSRRSMTGFPERVGSGIVHLVPTSEFAAPCLLLDESIRGYDQLSQSWFRDDRRVELGEFGCALGSKQR